MSGWTDFSARPLRGSILRSVSRSFYLSIRILPSRLREPVALAYLLARATDTVADTARIPGIVRAETLQTLSNLIQGKAPQDGIDSLAAASSPVRVAHPSRLIPVGSIADLVSSFAPLQENAAERTLLESLPHCLEWLEQLKAADRDDVRAVLEKITQGQTLDLQRADCRQVGDAGAEPELVGRVPGRDARQTSVALRDLLSRGHGPRPSLPAFRSLKRIGLRQRRSEHLHPEWISDRREGLWFGGGEGGELVKEPFHSGRGEHHEDAGRTVADVLETMRRVSRHEHEGARRRGS